MRTDRLAALRVPGDAPAPTETPVLDAKRHAHTVLSFDPSFTATGWTLLHAGEDNQIVLDDWGTIKSPVGKQEGWRSTLERVKVIDIGVENLLHVIRQQWDLDMVCIEMPHSGQNGKRTESSMVTGALIAKNCWDRDIPHCLLSAQRARTLVCGNSHADKKQIAQSLSTVDWIVNNRTRNENERDALMLGIAYLIGA